MNHSTDSEDGDDDYSMKGDIYCRDFLMRSCIRANCRYSHDIPPPEQRKSLMVFCHDFQNKGCFRPGCKFVHCTIEDEEEFYRNGILPTRLLCKDYSFGNCKRKNCKYFHPKNERPDQLNVWEQDDYAPNAKKKRTSNIEESVHCANQTEEIICNNCENMNNTVNLLHENISVLLQKVADLTQQNSQLTAMNEFLLDHTASLRGFTRDQKIVSSVASATPIATPTAIATVSVAPVVSLAGLVPPAQGLITVSSAAQIVGGSAGTLIVTSAGAPQLMAASTPATLVSGAQAVVIAPQQQNFVQNISAAEAQLVQQTITNSTQQLPNSQATPVSFPVIL